jgi:hypothetical protein
MRLHKVRTPLSLHRTQGGSHIAFRYLMDSDQLAKEPTVLLVAYAALGEAAVAI